jgi:cytochrome c oxidase subunit 3
MMAAEFARPARKQLGMWLFVAGDALTFAAMLLSYAYLRVGTSNWPLVFHLVPSLLLGVVMTLILLGSSATARRAVREIQRSNPRSARMWLVSTLGAGLIFAGLHAHEWSVLIRAGVTPFDNPWGVPLFGATFFAITGLHLAHVLAGVVYLGIVAARMRADEIETAAVYWHFVDAVWLLIFPAVYLTSANL